MAGTIQTLLVTADPRLEETLAARSGVAVVATCLPQEARQVSTLRRPDVILVDLDLPGLGGYELCRQLRGDDPEQRHYGIIGLASGAGLQLVKGLDSSCDDCCPKANLGHELAPRIAGVLRDRRLAQNLHASNQKLAILNHYLAKVNVTDEVSGLYNMRYFWQRLRQEIIRAGRHAQNLSLIMFDLDNFKAVNDQHDHLLGSFVLAEVGRLVARTIRRDDVAARYGGDEFIIMLPETPQEGAQSLAERLSAKIQGTVFDNGSASIRVTASFGTTTMVPERQEALTADELILAADTKLYEAKAQGKNRVC